MHLKTVDTADAQAAPILNQFKRRFGAVPNFYAALGISGAVLEGYLSFEHAVEAGCLLTKEQRELIALAVANRNGCQYCVSGHTFSATRIGMDRDTCALAQKGQARLHENQLILDLALSIVEKQGHLEDRDLHRYLSAGMSEAMIIQVCAWAGINTFSNWVNNIVLPPIDFPRVPLLV